MSKVCVMTAFLFHFLGSVFMEISISWVMLATEWKEVLSLFAGNLKMWQY